MPLVQIHEETYKGIPDSSFLGKLVASCVETRQNPDMLCALIRILLKREVLGSCFDSRRITNPESVKFFQEQFDRATLTLA